MLTIHPTPAETWMWHTFGYGATVTSVKVKRDAATGQSAGFGFVEFPTTFEAEQVLIGYQVCHRTSTVARSNTTDPPPPPPPPTHTHTQHE